MMSDWLSETTHTSPSFLRKQESSPAQNAGWTPDQVRGDAIAPANRIGIPALAVEEFVRPARRGARRRALAGCKD